MENIVKMIRQKDIPIPFGKYKGILIVDIDNDYLNWLLEQDWFCQKFPEHKKQIEIEIAYRNKFNIVV